MSNEKRRYREARERAGLKPEEACVRLGISISTLYNWEKGRTKPDARDLRAMAEAYGTSADYLLGMA